VPLNGRSAQPWDWRLIVKVQTRSPDHGIVSGCESYFCPGEVWGWPRQEHGPGGYL